MSKLITEESLGSIVSSLQDSCKTVVFASGVFDILHIGHVKYLTEAKLQGDCLVVFVHTDASVKRMKGADRPVIAQDRRVELLSALACVNYIVLFDEEKPHRVLQMFKPDVMVRSGIPKGNVKELVEGYGGKAHYVDLEDISSTKIMESIKHPRTSEGLSGTKPVVRNG